MILFVGILVLAFAAHLDVRPSAAIDGAQSAATSGLSSWNPNVTCGADLVTIQDVLGSAYPHQSLSGSRYQHNATSGGIPLERSLSPPCTITNINGAVLSPFVQINGVSLYGYGVKTTDCSGWYSKQNGGQRYPGNKTFCTNAGQIITLGTTSGYMKIEIDRDWLGKGYCGPNVPSCNNATLGQEQSNGSISLDFQGFVFWEGPWHWELHPLTGWRLSAPPAPPSAPQNLAATGGNAQVGLTWQAPGSNGGSPITNYKIYRSLAPGSETLLTTVGNVLTYTDTTVTNGVTYYYQVSAVNSPGEGAKSNEASATPNASPPTPPSAPTNLAATGGNAQVGLTWQAPGSNGGSPITNYRIYRGTAPGTETLLTTVGAVTSYTDTAVTNGVTYYYQVSAVSNVGEGPRSNEASATPTQTPPPPSPPSAPTNLAATGGNAQVTLTWQAPASNGGSPITNYKIYRGTTSGSETLIATIGNQLSYSDGGLTNGVTYYYQVSAVNSVGEGPRSNEASATPTAPATPPGAPQGLVATAGDATVTLTWSAPSSNGGSPITNYKVYRGTTSGGETLKATIGNVLTYTDTTVTNGVTYYYQVSAVNAAGEGPRSNEASATPSPPPPPPDFSISATPASLSIQIGSSGTSTITLNSLNGFAGTIGLSSSISCSGLCLVYPTASLNPTSVTLTAGGSGVSTLTVATSVLTTPGTYTITITATSGSITHTVTVTVTVHL
jgi:fibronectin type 3 domain-containing protein